MEVSVSPELMLLVLASISDVIAAVAGLSAAAEVDILAQRDAL